MMHTKHQPQRTCVICREKKDKRSLTRIVQAESGLTIDRSGKMNGRGAYLCETPDCWDRAISSHILAKALRSEMNDDDRAYLRQIKPS